MAKQNCYFAIHNEYDTCAFPTEFLNRMMAESCSWEVYCTGIDSAVYSIDWTDKIFSLWLETDAPETVLQSTHKIPTKLCTNGPMPRYHASPGCYAMPLRMCTMDYHKNRCVGWDPTLSNNDRTLHQCFMFCHVILQGSAVHDLIML